MKRRFLMALFLFALSGFSSRSALAFEKWDVPGEISRLASEAPALEAFPGAPGVVWKSSDRYSLTPEGGRRHDSIFILLLGEGESGGSVNFKRFARPSGDGASLEITSAEFYDPAGGELIGELPVREYDENGSKGTEILFPDEAKGHLAAITATEIVPGDYRLDDVIPFSGVFPAWEQTVEVELPDGMNVYWEGVGVREPEKIRSGRNQTTKWSLSNEPAWISSGLVDSGKPSLAFSLSHGQLPALKSLRALESPAYAPAAPKSVSSSRSNLVYAAQNIFKYMSPRLMPAADGAVTVRPSGEIPPEGPWTEWEQVLIAARWLASLGFDAKVYWLQALPVGTDGPASMKIWKEPILKASDGSGHEIYFKAGQYGEPEKLHPSLYGASLYRAGTGGVERVTLPRGSASDHTLSQSWKMTVGEDGRASGTLDVTITGGWSDVFALRRGVSDGELAAGVLRGMNFNIPGVDFTALSTKELSNGWRVAFSVEAVPGIPSSGNLLVKLMGGVPAAFGDIPRGGVKYELRFPFVFEINSIISTPKEYKALSVPDKIKAGDGKAMVDASLAHWTKRALAEGSCRWIVRSFSVDEYLSGRIAEQLAVVSSWPDAAIPLRK